MLPVTKYCVFSEGHIIQEGLESCCLYYQLFPYSQCLARQHSLVISPCESYEIECINEMSCLRWFIGYKWGVRDHSSLGFTASWLLIFKASQQMREINLYQDAEQGNHHGVVLYSPQVEKTGQEH